MSEIWGAPPPQRAPSAAERAALDAIYRDVDAALGPVSGACRACGKCCRFEPGGIVLFASALELANLVEKAGRPPVQPSQPRLLPLFAARRLLRRAKKSRRSRLAARAQHGPPDAAWRCPYQEKNLCTARPARPLGCRTYFCDAALRSRGEEVYREAHERIRRMCVRPQGAAGAESRWWYGPARAYLATLAEKGTVPLG